jgi:predicted HicB family RNase H-like nuclease
MTKRIPPKVNTATPIGRDVDLETETVRLKNGKRLTNKVAERIIEEGKRTAGRPSLSGAAKTSPQIAFRVPAETRQLAEKIAASEHKTVSQLAREALEDRLKRRAG